MREPKFRFVDTGDGTVYKPITLKELCLRLELPRRIILESENGDFVDTDDFLDLLEKGELIAKQYTDLKDKNGKEIYEGDIVRYAFEYPKGEWVEEVSFGKISDGEGYYHDYFLAWRTTDKDGDGHQSLLDLEGYCEVIGNIHENPELLKEV